MLPKKPDQEAQSRDNKEFVSFQSVNIINIATIAKPIRNPISWAFAESGRPRAASTK